MKIVADTNTFLAVILGEPERSWILAATAGHELLAPAVLPYEIGNALSAMLKRGVLESQDAEAAWEAAQGIPVDLREVDIRSALAIAAKLSLYAYDAYFLDCAVRQRAPLLTLDRGLRHAAAQIGVAVIKDKP